jgi:hypothetical protein
VSCIRGVALLFWTFPTSSKVWKRASAPSAIATELSSSSKKPRATTYRRTDLADNLAALEEQLRTALDFLTLLTREGSIATEGYDYGIEFINNNRQAFHNAIKERPSFCAEYAYVLDRVFQKFLNQLGRYHSRPDAISRARKSLRRGFQKGSVDSTLAGFAFGSIPNLCLPAGLSLREADTSSEKRKDRGGKSDSPPGKPKSVVKLEWWSTNPGLEPSWAPPDGKTYNDYFNGKDPVQRKNLFSWPDIKHHSLGRRKPLCVKYQVIGKCSAGCTLAHQPPSQMSPSAKTAASKR